MERHLATVWESVADAISEEPAVVQGDRRTSWRDYEERAARLAGALAEAGLGHGSKVAQYLFNCPEYLESYFAALKIRAIPVNVNYRYLDDELLYLLDNCEADALLFPSSLGERVARVVARAPKLRLVIEVDDGGEHLDGADAYEDLVARSEPAPRIVRDPDDITMLYTGGTTGMPKGVMSRIGTAVTTHMTTVPPMVRVAPPERPEDVARRARQLVDEGRQIGLLPACPLMHGTGLASATTSMTFGSRTVLLEGRHFDAGHLWSTVEAESVTVLAIVGDAFARPMLRALQEGPGRDLASVEWIVSAGAMFSYEVREELLEFVPQARIVDHIAASEGAMGVAVSSIGAVVPTGRFTPHPGVVVFTEDLRPVHPGSEETGMVAIPGNIPDGYYKDDAKTAKTFPVIDGVRYSIPGDWAAVDADGSILLLGRGSQCINTGGEKVFPEEVEEIIKIDPAVEDCLVFGLPDERFGQRVVAVASPRAGETIVADDVLAGARRRLAAYKLPRQLLPVEVVPRAPNGKADYPAARRLFEERVRVP